MISCTGDHPRSVPPVRRRVVGFLLGLGALLAGCGGTAASRPPTTTTSRAATTTSLVATTTSTSTSSTTVPVPDATTADPKALASHLQAVLDRFQALFMESRSDPNRPLQDAALYAEFRKVAGKDVLAGLVQRWQEFEADGTAVRSGTSIAPGPFLTTIVPTSTTTVSGRYCAYDDAITYMTSSGNVLSDRTVVAHGDASFTFSSGAWLIVRLTQDTRETVASGSVNSCLTERITA
jgi:hypothetical protein